MRFGDSLPKVTRSWTKGLEDPLGDWFSHPHVFVVVVVVSISMWTMWKTAQYLWKTNAFTVTMSMTMARVPVPIPCGLEKRVVKLFIDISPIWIILWLLINTMYIGSLIIKSFGSKNYVHLSVGRFFDRLHFFFEPRNSCRIAIDLISINAHAQRTRLNLSCIQTCY